MSCFVHEFKLKSKASDKKRIRSGWSPVNQSILCIIKHPLWALERGEGPKTTLNIGQIRAGSQPTSYAVNPSSRSNSIWAQASSVTIHSGMMTEVHRLTLASAAAGMAFSRSWIQTTWARIPDLLLKEQRGFFLMNYYFVSLSTWQNKVNIITFSWIWHSK